VALKDDNLGLGAKRGSGQIEGQCTGLDAFQGLLGRLNGKTDGQLQKEQESRMALKRAMYTEGRRGSVRFVSAGFLVGAKIEVLENSEPANHRVVPKLGRPQQPTARLSSPSTQEAQEHDATRPFSAEPEPLAPGETMSRKKESKRSRSHRGVNDVASVEAAVVQRKTQLGGPTRSLSSSTAALSSSVLEDGPTSSENGAQEKEAKAERKRLKPERRALRAAKRKRKVGREISSTTMACTDPSEPSTLVEDNAKAPNIADHRQSDSSNTVPTPSSAAMFSGGRHAVRRRYIQQKKLAVIDGKALNEVRPYELTLMAQIAKWI